MNPKVLIIPDVHGRSFWKEPVKDIIENYNDVHVVFLGDYTDPYLNEIDSVTGEAITTSQGYDSLLDVIKVKNENPDRVTLLLGNHDLGYVSNYIHNERRRKDFKNEASIRNTILGNINLFDLAYEVTVNEKKFLLTHSGVTTKWVTACETLLKDYDESFTFSVDNVNRILHTQFGTPNSYNLNLALSYVSYYRGGDDNCSSMVWTDVREHLEPDSTNWADEHGYIQVFGHTQLSKSGVSIEGKSFCLDVRKAFYIDVEGNIRDYTTEEIDVVNISEDERKYLYNKRFFGI